MAKDSTASDKYDGIDFSFTRESDKSFTVEPTYSGVLSFARRRYTKDLVSADLAVVGIPYDLATTSRPGARLGPRAVREASTLIAWDRVHEWSFNPFEKIAVVDFGDVLFDLGLPQQIPAAVSQQFSEIFETNTKTLMLGGDHFCTYPVLKALAKKHDEPLALIHFDAHSDTWAEDQQSLNHGTMFYHAAKEGLVDPASSVQIGLRTYNEEDHGFNILTAETVRAQGVEKVIQSILEITNDKPVYLTFDVDCLDPSVAPGTGTPVIGGLDSMEAQQILRGLAGINLIGADVVEVAPAYDVSQITALAAATMAMNIVCLFAASS